MGRPARAAPRDRPVAPHGVAVAPASVLGGAATACHGAVRRRAERGVRRDDRSRVAGVDRGLGDGGCKRSLRKRRTGSQETHRHYPQEMLHLLASNSLPALVRVGAEYRSRPGRVKPLLGPRGGLGPREASPVWRWVAGQSPPELVIGTRSFRSMQRSASEGVSPAKARGLASAKGICHDQRAFIGTERKAQKEAH